MYTKNDKWIRKCILQLASDIYMVTTTTSKKQTQEVFYKKVIFKNFAILTGKHLRWSFI